MTYQYFMQEVALIKLTHVIIILKSCRNFIIFDINILEDCIKDVNAKGCNAATIQVESSSPKATWIKDSNHTMNQFMVFLGKKFPLAATLTSTLSSAMVPKQKLSLSASSSLMRLHPIMSS